MSARRSGLRRGFTIRDLAAALTCLVVGGSLLVSLTGANRNLSQTQVCANNLRTLFAGMAAYVNQYNSYPPNAPYPNYVTPHTIAKIVGQDVASGWDPNIGFIMTYGLGMEPPARDTSAGGNNHFVWYVLSEDELPDIVVCPAAKRELMFEWSAEVSTPGYKGEGVPLESFVYQYAAFYQTAGTCRAATRMTRQAGQDPPSPQGIGGRQPLIPDPTGGDVYGSSSKPYDNSQRGNPYVYVCQKKPGMPMDDPTVTPSVEPQCYIQAVHPSEVQAPGRTYYLADSREYRPQAKGSNYDWPPGTFYNGWVVGWGNVQFLGTRHFGYSNVMYLDGRVSRGNQYHDATWNLTYNPSNPGASGVEWRAATFATDIKLANIRRQVHVMPVLMVRGWEYFFDSSGLLAK